MALDLFRVFHPQPKSKKQIHSKHNKHLRGDNDIEKKGFNSGTLPLTLIYSICE
jgi:hypothetical protein